MSKTTHCGLFILATCIFTCINFPASTDSYVLTIVQGPEKNPVSHASSGTNYSQTVDYSIGFFSRTKTINYYGLACPQVNRSSTFAASSSTLTIRYDWSGHPSSAPGAGYNLNGLQTLNVSASGRVQETWYWYTSSHALASIAANASTTFNGTEFPQVGGSLQNYGGQATLERGPQLPVSVSFSQSGATIGIAPNDVSNDWGEFGRHFVKQGQYTYNTTGFYTSPGNPSIQATSYYSVWGNAAVYAQGKFPTGCTGATYAECDATMNASSLLVIDNFFAL